MDRHKFADDGAQRLKHMIQDMNLKHICDDYSQIMDNGTSDIYIQALIPKIKSIAKDTRILQSTEDLVFTVKKILDLPSGLRKTWNPSGNNK